MRLWRLILNLAVVILSVPLFAQQPSADVQTRRLRQLYESYAKKYRFYDDTRPIIVPQIFSVQWENAYTAEKEQQRFCEAPIQSPRGLYALRYSPLGPDEVRVSQRLVIIEYLDQVRDGRPLFVPYIRSVIPDRDSAAYDIDTLYRHLSTKDFSGIVCYSDLGGRLITVGRFVKGKIRAHEFIATQKSSAAKLVNVANTILYGTTLHAYSDTMSAVFDTPKNLNGRELYAGNDSTTKVAYDLERCPICCEYIDDDYRQCHENHLLLYISPYFGNLISRQMADGTLFMGSQPTVYNYNKGVIMPSEIERTKNRRISFDSLCRAYADRPIGPLFDSLTTRYQDNIYFLKHTTDDISYRIAPITHHSFISTDTRLGAPITAVEMMKKIDQGRCFIVDSRSKDSLNKRCYRAYDILDDERIVQRDLYFIPDMFNQRTDRVLCDSIYISKDAYACDSYIVPRATFDLNDSRVVDLEKFSSENDYVAINALLEPRGRWLEWAPRQYVFKGSGDDPVYLIDRAEMTDSTIVVRQVFIVKSGAVDDRRTKENPQAGIIFDDELLDTDIKLLLD